VRVRGSIVPAVPPQMQAVVLTGTGFDSIKLVDLPVPEPNDDQVLCRVDACTVCPSIPKLISQGAEHKFLDGWDIGRHPIILGDEGAVTVVKPGKNLAKRVKAGEKYAIQPAGDHKPVNNRDRYRDPEKMKKVAVGYTLGGTWAQYILVLEEVIEAGCLVRLPSQDIGAYEVSLAEPLSCVVSGQDHHVHLVADPKTGERFPRKGVLEGGVAVVIGAGVMGRFHIELALTYRPRVVVVFNRSQVRFEKVRRYIAPRAERLGIKLFAEPLDLKTMRETLKRLTGQDYGDDVIETTASPEVAEAAMNSITGRGTVFDTFGGLNIGDNVVPTDLRKIHYDESVLTGSSGGNPFDTKRPLDLIHSGDFNVGTEIAAVGDLSHAADFLKLVAEKKIDGKALVYPHTKLDGPLTVTEPWTREKEREHVRRYAVGER